MKLAFWIGIPVVILLCVWIARGYFTSNVERPTPTAVESYEGFEVRTLPAQIVATVTVSASDESEASGRGFQALAGFIFGDNIRQDSIAMTAPVTSKAVSQKIAMTAPVTSNKSSDGTYEVAFIMPSEWTMETLPLPNNPAVKITQEVQRNVAVYTFGGYARSDAVTQNKKVFQELLDKQNISTQGSVTLAQYNDPRTPPWMRTNELRISIQK